MTEMSEMSMSSMSGISQGPGMQFPETAQERRERKKQFVRVGTAVIVVLLVLDIILLYLYLSAKPRVVVIRKTSVVQGFRRSRLEKPALSDDHVVGQQRAPKPTPPLELPCKSPGCAWLRKYLEGSVRKVDPCDDFYAHVCTERTVSLRRHGLARFMEAVAMAVLARGQDSERQLHVDVLEQCLRARDVLRRDVLRVVDDVQPCPKVPIEVPWFATPFLEGVTNGSASSLWKLLLSWSPQLGSALRRSPPQQVGDQWMYAVARRVAHAARCYQASKGVFTKLEQIAYESIWNVFYFAPFLGEEGEALIRHAYQGPPSPRLQNCLRILEDRFLVETHRAALEALRDVLDDPSGAVGRLLWKAKQAARSRLAYWFGEPARRAVDLVGAMLLGTPQALRVADRDWSVFSFQVQYSSKVHSLVMPPALLGSLLNVTPTIEPVFVPLLGEGILRALIQGASSWVGRSHSPLEKTTLCIKYQLRAELPVAREVTLRSAVLPPLYDLYRRRLQEDLGSGVKLHDDYSNAQLFYVLWALSRCGDDGPRAEINSPLANSAHFARSFGCLPNQEMVALSRCRVGELLS